MSDELEMVRSLVRGYMLGERVDVAYCMTTLLGLIDRVERLHRRGYSAATIPERYCAGCGGSYPCSTKRLLSDEGKPDAADA
jgi:hypothetical protein